MSNTVETLVPHASTPLNELHGQDVNRKGQETVSAVDPARLAAYQIGIARIAPWIQRILDLEQKVGVLMTRLDALESATKNSAPPHLHAVEKR
jgi:hypothetical protein